jgi:hypothetical protein
VAAMLHTYTHSFIYPAFVLAACFLA